MTLYSHEQNQDNNSWLKNYLKQIQKAQRETKPKTSREEDLIKSHLSLVVSLARKYMHYDGVNVADLIQDGNMGLIKAAKKFNPAKGYQFSTYATWWVKQALMQSFAEHDRLIRLPGHTITDLAKIKRAISQLERSQTLSKNPDVVQQIASLTKLTPRKITQLLPYLNRMQSIDYTLEEDSGSPRPIEMIVCNDENVLNTLEQQELFDFIEASMTKILTRKEQTVISKRYLNDINSPSGSKMSLNSLGVLFSTSRETIRQIEKTSLQKLKHEILHHKLYD